MSSNVPSQLPGEACQGPTAGAVRFLYDPQRLRLRSTSTGEPALRILPGPSVRIAQEHSAVLVGTRRWTPWAADSPGGGEEGVEAEHPDEQHGHKGNCNQERV